MVVAKDMMVVDDHTVVVAKDMMVVDDHTVVVGYIDANNG